MGIKIVLMVLVLWLRPSSAVTEIIGGGSLAAREVLEDTMFAYSLVNDGLFLSYQPLGDLPMIKLLQDNKADFAVTDLVLTPQQYATTPDLLQLPLLAQAIVPAYSLPGIPSEALLLARETLVDILMGNITMWNDTRLAALNPALELPGQPIKLVLRQDSCALNQILGTALSSFSSLWTGGNGETLNWEPAALAQALVAYSPTETSTILSTTPFTFAYLWYTDAIVMGVSAARMINRAGNVAVPHADAVSFAVLEKGSQTFVRGSPFLDITDPFSATAWPLSGFSYLVVRSKTLRRTCQIRTDMLKFFRSVYTSDVLANIAKKYHVVILPTSVNDVLGVEMAMYTQVFCEGTLSLPSETTTKNLGAGAELAGPFYRTYTTVYPLFDPEATQVEYLEMSSEQALERLEVGEVGFAVIITSIMNEDRVTKTMDSGFALIPAFSLPVAPTYHLPGQQADDPTLLLSYDVLGLMMTANITRWDHPEIVKLNPQLHALGRLTGPLTVVAATEGEREPARIFLWALAYNTPYFNTTAQQRLTETQTWTLSDVPDWHRMNTLEVDSLRKIPAALASTAGTVAFLVPSSSVDTRFAHIVKKDGRVVEPSREAVYACMRDSWDTRLGRYRLYRSQQPDCWNLAAEAYTVVKEDHVGWPCATTRRQLNFLTYLHSRDHVTETAAESGARDVATALGVMLMPPERQEEAQASLDAVRCDGETLLVTLPVPHKIDSNVYSAALTLTVIGCCLAGLGVFFVWYFRLRTAIKSASPVFLSFTGLGLVLLFLSGVFLADPSPTDATCGATFWLANLGFFFAFAPVFAKQFRIYKIFLRSKMQVVKITDAKLMSRMAMFFLIEVVMLIIVQFVSPLRATTGIQAASPRNQLVAYCSPNDVGPMAAVAAYKSLILVFGIMMTFSTRSVAETFNESKSVAFAIYNVLFTTILVVAIAMLIQKDVVTVFVLIIFALYWLSSTTWLSTFAPKIYAVYKNATSLLADRISNSRSYSGSHMSGNSRSISRSLREFFGTPIRLMDRTTLKAYLQLLEKEVGEVRTQLATLDANEGVLNEGGRRRGKEHLVLTVNPDPTPKGPVVAFR